MKKITKILCMAVAILMLTTVMTTTVLARNGSGGIQARDGSCIEAVGGGTGSGTGIGNGGTPNGGGGNGTGTGIGNGGTPNGGGGAKLQDGSGGNPNCPFLP